MEITDNNVKAAETESAAGMISAGTESGVYIQPEQAEEFLNQMLVYASGCMTDEKMLDEEYSELIRLEEKSSELERREREIRQRREHLYEESVRADEYRELLKARRKNDINIIISEINRCSEETDLLSIQIADLEKRLDECRSERERLENAFYEKRKLIEETEREIEEGSKELFSAKEKLSEDIKDTEVTGNVLTYENGIIAYLDEEISRNRSVIENLVKRAFSYESQIMELQRSADACRQEMLENENSLRMFREKYRSIEHDYVKLNEELIDCEGRKSLAESRRESYSAILESVRERMRLLDDELSLISVDSAERELDKDRKLLRSTAEKKRDAEMRLEMLEKNAERLRNHRETLLSRSRKLEEDVLNAKASEHQLRELESVSGVHLDDLERIAGIGELIRDRKSEGFISQQNLNEVNADISSIDTELGSNDDQIKAVLGEIGKLEKIQAQSEYRTDVAAYMIQERRNLYEALKNEAESSALAEADAENAEKRYAREADSLKLDAERIRKEMEMLYRPAEEINGKISDLEKKLQESAGRAAELKSGILGNESLIREIKKQIAYHETRSADVRSDADERESTLIEIRKELASQDVRNSSAGREVLRLTEEQRVRNDRKLVLREGTGKIFTDFRSVMLQYSAIDAERLELTARVKSGREKEDALKKKLADELDISYGEAVSAADTVFALNEGLVQAERIKNAIRSLGNINTGASAELEKYAAESRRIMAERSELTESIAEKRKSVSEKENSVSGMRRDFAERFDSILKERAEGSGSEVKVRISPMERSRVSTCAYRIGIEKTDGSVCVLSLADEEDRQSAVRIVMSAVLGFME